MDTAGFKLDKLVDDIEHARQSLGLGRIAVNGHSDYSFMALEYAKKYPANLSHVIMIGIAPDLSAASAEATEQYWQTLASPERKAAMEEDVKRLTDEQLAQLPPGQRLIKTYIRIGPRIWYNLRFDSSPLWEGAEINMDMLDYVWGQVFRDIDITQGLDTLDRPAFLALGRYDFIVPQPSTWDPIRPKFRDLTVRVFERSGHTPQYEDMLRTGGLGEATKWAKVLDSKIDQVKRLGDSVEVLVPSRVHDLGLFPTRPRPSR